MCFNPRTSRMEGDEVGGWGCGGCGGWLLFQNSTEDDLL